MLKKWVCVFIFSISSMIVINPLEAATFLYSLDTVYSGGTPAGPAPWLTASFTDVGLNQVRLDMSASGLKGTEFIGGWYFNFNPNQSASDLVFTRLDTPLPGDPKIYTGTNAFKAGGDGYFDILFDFPNAPIDKRFLGGETISFLITSLNPLDASMFDYTSDKKKGNSNFFSAAHIQALGNGDSSWIAAGGGKVPVPEPTTMLVLGTTGAIAAYVKRKRSKKL